MLGFTALHIFSRLSLILKYCIFGEEPVGSWQSLSDDYIGEILFVTTAQSDFIVVAKDMPGAEKQESPVLVVERSNSFSQLKLLRSGLKQWLMLECSNNNPNCTQSLQSSNCAKQIYNFKIQDTDLEEFVFYINITMKDKAGKELHDTALAADPTYWHQAWSSALCIFRRT